MFSKLVGLKEFNLHNSIIRGLPTSVFSKLTGLKGLHIYDNKISAFIRCAHSVD